MSRCNRIDIAHYSFGYWAAIMNYILRDKVRGYYRNTKSFYDMILKLLLHQTIVAIDISLQHSSSQF